MLSPNEEEDVKSATRIRATAAPSTRWRPLLGSLLLLLLPAAPLAAQSADFLFGRPGGTIAFMAGFVRPDESADLFEFTRDQLTVGRGDFTSALVGAEVGFRTSDHVDLTLGLEYAGRSVSSEMRDWVTQDDQPILQTTEYTRWRATAGAKAYLLSRGRRVSEYAWVPASWSPYLGAGVGFTWYDFTQHGDFVDFQTLDIFADRLSTADRGFTPWVAAGLDLSLSTHFILRLDARHYWGSADVDDAVFDGFNDIDLSGYQATIGLAFRTGGGSL